MKWPCWGIYTLIKGIWLYIWESETPEEQAKDKEIEYERNQWGDLNEDI